MKDQFLVPQQLKFYQAVRNFNPFTTEPQAIFLLLENDNLGIFN